MRNAAVMPVDPARAPRSCSGEARGRAGGTGAVSAPAFATGWRRPGRTAVALALGATVALALGLAFPADTNAGALGGPTSSSTTTTTRVTATTAKPATTTTPPTGPASSVAPTSAPSTTAAPTTTSTPSGTLAPPTPSDDAPFPAALVGPVPPAAGGPDLDINDVYAAISEDLSAPDVVVRYRAPFALPSGAYRVSVLIGDPSGARLRASLVSTGGGAKPKGIVETREADAWREIGPTTASFQPGGFVIVRVPMPSAPPGGAVWAEITQGNATTPAHVTPYFSRDALFATATPKGSMPISPFGRVTNPDGTMGADAVAVPAGPVLRVGRELVSVVNDGPVPTEMLGQPVKDVFDTVRVAPNFDNGAVITNFIRINRTDNTTALFDGFGATPTDKSGDRSWIVSGPAADAKAGTGTITFNRQAMGDALGVELPVGTPATTYRTGFGLLRTIVLADGRVITTDAVMGTDAWFGLGPEPTLPTTTVPAGSATVADGDAAERLPVAVVAGAAAVILVGILMLLMGRRRRSRARADEEERVAARRDDGLDRVPWGRDDGMVTARATAEIDAIRTTGVVSAVPAAVAADDPAGGAEGIAPGERVAATSGFAPADGFAPAGEGPTAAADDLLGAEPAAVADPARSDAVEPDEHLHAAEKPGNVEDPADPASADTGARSDPMAALAALDLQVSAFRSRLDGLEGDDPAGSGEHSSRPG